MRVVITGIGAVTPIGNNAKDFWQGIKDEKLGIDYITQFDANDAKVKIAGEVKGFSYEGIIEPKEARRMARVTQLTMVACDEAVNDSGIIGTVDDDELAVVVGAGIGGIGEFERETQKVYSGKAKLVSPFLVPSMIPNILGGYVAIKYNAKNICTCPVVACATGTYAIGDAFELIKSGKAKAAICGGSESTITPTVMTGFANMTALSTKNDPEISCTPFDKSRDGFVLAEGAGILILEEYEHAKSRNAKIYAEVVGYGATCDAYHITAPSPDGDGAARAMKLAMKEAGITANEVDYINAHGTGTPANDKTETASIKLALGEEKAKEVMINSTKSMTGHGLGAAGALEAIVCAMSLKEGFVHRTIGLTDQDEECDLNYMKDSGKNVDIKYTLSNSLGFGGHNGTLCLKKI